MFAPQHQKVHYNSKKDASAEQLDIEKGSKSIHNTQLTPFDQERDNKPKSTSQNSPRVTRFERINELTIEKEERKSSQKAGILKDPNMSQLERLSMRSGNSVDFAEDQLDKLITIEDKKDPKRNTEEGANETGRKEETSIRF